MSFILNIIEVCVSILLCILILLQHRASGLTSTFGGSGAVVVQRRGAEKVLYKLSVWLSVIFFALSLAHLYFAL